MIDKLFCNHTFISVKQAEEARVKFEIPDSHGVWDHDAKWKQISSESEDDENGANDQLRSGWKASGWLAQHANDHGGDAGTAAEVPSMEDSDSVVASYIVEDED